MEYKEVNLDTLNGGSAKDLFDEEFKKVLNNINDINSEPDAVREVKLIFKIKPSKDRRSATTSVQATSKLAGAIPHQGSMFLGFAGNRPKAYVNDIRQTMIDFPQQTQTPSTEPKEVKRADIEG